VHALGMCMLQRCPLLAGCMAALCLVSGPSAIVQAINGMCALSSLLVQRDAHVSVKLRRNAVSLPAWVH
jgi:hypothetical protein